MKVCSLYGAGFFYIPGTDTCLKVGGFVRVDYGFNAGGSHGQYWNGAQANYDRGTNEFTTRARTLISFDARTQTEYGTLRSYSRLGFQYSTDDPDVGALYNDRAFIQLGGFTFGKTASFFDAFQGGFASFTTLVGTSDTGTGVNVAAYTAQFGNGLSGTIAIEDPTYRRSAGLLGATTVYGGKQMPDVVGNLRVDQAWGSAQLSAAVHQVRVGEFGVSPDDKYGFAVQGAVQVNLPWAAGDKFTVQAGYAEGASHYMGLTKGTYDLYTGADQFVGYAPDGWVDATGAIELTKVFGINAGIEHYWTPGLRSSVFGAYTSVELPAGTSADWNMYQLGGRTVWNPVKNLDVGVEVLYTKFEDGDLASEADVFSGLVRVQRNFWP